MTETHAPSTDEATFARVVRQCAADAHAYLHGMLTDIAAADDALGEAMIRLARSASRFNPAELELDWVLSAARRVAIDRAPPLENAPGFATKKSADGLKASLRSLSFSDRELLVLREILNWDLARIAEFAALDQSEVITKLNASRQRITN